MSVTFLTSQFALSSNVYLYVSHYRQYFKQDKTKKKVYFYCDCMVGMEEKSKNLNRERDQCKAKWDKTQKLGICQWVPMT